ncbi:MAG: pilus assembly protein PilM [Candidatus Omnitrophota bacterium]
MASEKQLGMFFCFDGLNLAEVRSRKLVSHYYMPYAAQPELMAENVADDIKLTAALKKALRDNKIVAKQAYVSLPTREFVVRSFSIPPIPKEEVHSAVEFEVKKYLPFRLEELYFDFQVFPVVEAKSKRLKVLFVGVKKTVLEKYISILSQAELKISLMEPHVFSIFRLLLSRRILPIHQTVMLLEKNFEEVTIVIAGQGVPQLIRDFKLSLAAVNNFPSGTESTLNQLLNEIKISCEYYHRQNPKADIAKMLFFSDGDLRELFPQLVTELKTPSFHYTHQDLLGVREEIKFGVLAAYGGALARAVKTPLTIDLARRRFRPEARVPRVSLEEVISPRALIKIGILGVALVSLVCITNIFKLQSLNLQLAAIRKQNVGQYTSESEIKNLIKDFGNKLLAVKEMATTDSFADKISSLPLLLPDGVWLTAMNIRFDSASSPAMVFKGVALSQDSTVELNLINQFVLNLKQSPQIGRHFKNISLANAVADKTPDKGGTVFEIICK